MIDQNKWMDPLDEIPDDLDDWCDQCGYDICQCENYYCCFEPMYRGPVGHCHCAEYNKQIEWEGAFPGKITIWAQKKWFRITGWIKRRYRNVFPKQHFTICSHCGQRYNTTKFHLDCPHCGMADLPF